MVCTDQGGGEGGKEYGFPATRAGWNALAGGTWRTLSRGKFNRSPGSPLQQVGSSRQEQHRWRDVRTALDRAQGQREPFQTPDPASEHELNTTRSRDAFRNVLLHRELVPAAPGSEVLIIQSRHPDPAGEHRPSHFSIRTPSAALAHLELLFCSSLLFQRVPRAQPALITAGEAGMGARSGRLDAGSQGALPAKPPHVLLYSPIVWLPRLFPRS